MEMFRGRMPAARVALFPVLLLAFGFGFIDLVIPLNFERLHIFLFNMTVGGSVILYYTSGGPFPGIGAAAYFLLSIAYAVLAFLGQYIPAVAVSVPLWAIVESARVRRFSFFPRSFFSGAPLSRKFHEASLLCLSLAFVLSTAVVLNNEYFNWIRYEKLALDVFFLGFSFPVSLITMSVMFYFLDDKKSVLYTLVSNGIFWAVNLGVIVFFAFIVLELFAAEVAAAGVLFAAVVALFLLFLKHGRALQQKQFLVSGMIFLLFTAVTGLLYIPAEALYGKNSFAAALLLKSHAYISLYGWNLTGLFVIIRWNDFPMRLNSAALIVFHWAVILMAPLGEFYRLAALAVFMAYAVLIYLLLFHRKYPAAAETQ